MSMHTPPAKKVKPKPLREVLSRILQQLQRRDQYLFFAQPVSKIEVPDYYDVIREPMDLGTMQEKLNSKGAYTTLDSFRNDLLLITRNAQLFNSIHGPSAIIHTEAIKLEQWGLKALAKEAPAVEEAIALASAEAAEAEAEAKRRRDEEQSKKTSSPNATPVPRSNGRLNIKIRKSSSFNATSFGTPRLMTPSHLQNEIKPKREDSASQGSNEEQAESDDDDESDEEDDSDNDSDDDEEDEDDDESDEDDDDDDDEVDDNDRGSVTNPAVSLSVDGARKRQLRDTSSAVKKKRRSSGPRRFSRKKKQPQRVSSILEMLTHVGSDGRPSVAPVSTTSGAVASRIPLKYRPDGAIDLEALSEDERRSLLRPIGLDAWPDVLTPFLHSIVSLHPDTFPTASTLVRDIKQVLDGFGSALAPIAQPSSVTYSHDLEALNGEQRRLPTLIPSGWMFDNGGPSIPVAWPGLVQSTTSAEREEEREKERKERQKEKNEEGGQTSTGRTPRKDREREREEDGMANLEDWTWPRPHLARLPEALDLGLYPGLLPQAWINHIQSQKGGPMRSRLPPYHLAAGTAFENALLDELTSHPHRALLGGKPGVISMSALHPTASHPDVTVAIEQALQRDWAPHYDDLKKLGARGCDVIRETVYGGPVGEAYASSLEDFVRGAMTSAEVSYEDEIDVEAEDERVKEEINAALPFSLPSSGATVNAPTAYFDENGEMYDQDAYIGVDFVPLDVRKEAGVSTFHSTISSVRQSPQVAASPYATKRSRSMSMSAPPPSKRQARGDSRASQIEEDLWLDDKKRQNNFTAESALLWDDDITAAFMRGTILSQPLMDHVRDNYVAPLTDGHLSTLMEISRQVKGEFDDAEASQSVGDATLLQLAEVPSELLVKHEDENSSLFNTLYASNPAATAESEQKAYNARVRHLVRVFLKQDYVKIKLQMHELIRAQGNAVNINMLARNEEDVRYALQLERSIKPLPRTLLPNPLLDVDDGLRRYAAALQRVSEANPGEERSTLIEHLRIAYIALGRHVPKLHQVAGRWTTWLTAARATLAKRAELEEAKRREIASGGDGGSVATHRAATPSATIEGTSAV